MKPRWMMWAFAALMIGSLPAAADDTDKADPPEEDTIYGMWYVQVMEGEVMPLDEQIRIEFDEKGVVRVFEDGDEAEVAGFKHDVERSQISIFEERNPADIEALIKYRFVDDALILRITEDPGNPERDEGTIVLTRNKEGAKAHQQMREAQGEEGSSLRQRMQSMTQMRGLFQGAITLATTQKERMPASLGELVTGEFVTPEYVLTPWSEHEVPEGFEKWEGQKKAEWANAHTGYVYLAAGRKMNLDPEFVVILELPAEDKPEQVRMCFGDGHSETKLYDEADKLIKKQTGHTIAQWRNTTSPGTGEMVLPKKGDDHDETEAADRDKP